MIGSKITARNFVHMLAVNADNDKLSDEAFREMVKNTIPHVEGGNVYQKYTHVKTVGDVKTYKEEK